jgi:hypothetical protein
VGLLDDLTSPAKERYAVSNDNVVQLIQPGTFQDQLTEVLRRGARDLLAQAVEAEVTEFLARHATLKTDEGRMRVVRHGHLPEREVMTGIGPVAVRQPRVRDRQAAAAVHAPLAVDRDASADPLLEGHIDGRLLGGARCFARQGCERTFSEHDRPPQGWLARGSCEVEGA